MQSSNLDLNAGHRTSDATTKTTMIRNFVTASLAFVGTALAPSVAAAQTSAGVQVGEVQTHTFATPLWNSMGVSSLEDLRGKPVLVDFWGTRCPPCIGAAVPASLKLQETFGDDLQVIFVESQGVKSTYALSFAVGQKWMGGRALWTSEAPFDSGATVLPACVLLGNDGRVLLKGNPIQLHKELERQIGMQIQAQKTPPAGAPTSVSVAWSEFYKGRFAKAIDVAEQARRAAVDNALALASVADALAAFRTRVDGRLTRTRWLLEHGFVDEAENELDVLSAALKGAAQYEPACSALRARLAEPGLVTERDAARALARLRTRFFESGGDASIARELEDFAAKNRATKAAARALDLARLVPGTMQPR